MARETKIDILKGILVLQMILGHCFQFYVNLDEVFVARRVVEFVNLSTFSGFMFCFGYISFGVYLQQPIAKVAPKILKNTAKCLIAYYISSMSYMIFVAGMRIRIEEIIDILLFRHLAGWSEFLLSFALITLFQFVLHPLLSKCSDLRIGIFMLITFCTILLPKMEIYPLFASVIDGEGGAYFPILKYGGYFLWGVFMAKNSIFLKKSIFVGTALSTLLYVILYIVNKQEPSRFPLSIGYLAGGALIVYCYYLLSGHLEKTMSLVSNYLAGVGSNSLLYLILSNFIIFSITSTVFYRRKIGYALALYVSIMLVIFYLERIHRTKKVI